MKKENRSRAKSTKKSGKKDLPGHVRRESDPEKKNMAAEPWEENQRVQLDYEMQMKKRNTMIR